MCLTAVVASVFLAQAANASSTPLALQTVPRFDQRLEWPLAHLHADTLWARAEGAGVTVAVVDTGIYTGQPALAHVLAADPIDLVGKPANGTADEAHGTEVAGLIAGRGSTTDSQQMAGLAPEATLLDVRVTTQPQHVTPAQIAAGIRAAVQAGAQIINVSLASGTIDQALQQAVAYARASDCLVVASAGDGGQPEYPADLPGVLSVGAASMNSTSLVSPPAFGPPDVYAPGIDLYSTAVPERSGVSAGYAHDLHGSDYATALVSAAAALLLSADPLLLLQDVELRLVQTAQPVGQSGTLNLDPLAALDQLPALTPSPSPRPAPHPSRVVTRHSSAKLILTTLLGLTIIVLAAALIAARRSRLWASNVPESWDEPW
jgi:membrane-anchored mycosin MYCP